MNNGLLEMLQIQYFHLFLRCQGTIEGLAKVNTAILESHSTQSLFHPLLCAISIGNMMPLSSGTKELVLPRHIIKLLRCSLSIFLNKPPHEADPGLPQEATLVLNFNPSQRGRIPNNFDYIWGFRNMNVHFKSFGDVKIIDRVTNSKGSLISRNVDMRNNPDNDETPRRFVIVESNIVFAEPNDIKVIDN